MLAFGRRTRSPKGEMWPRPVRQLSCEKNSFESAISADPTSVLSDHPLVQFLMRLCVHRKGGIDSDLVVIDVLVERCFMEGWATRKAACVALGDVMQSAQSNGDYRAMQVMSHIPKIEQYGLLHCARDPYSAEKEEAGSRKHSGCN
jgi:hypothetical protein